MENPKKYRPAADWHRSRREKILAAHPEVAKLNGRNSYTPVINLGLIALQSYFAIALERYPWWAAMIVAYLFGGWVEGVIFTSCHEYCHNLGPKNRTWTQILLTLGSICTPNNWGNMFRHFHMSHHINQGSHDKNEYGDLLDNEHLILKSWNTVATEKPTSKIFFGIKKILKLHSNILQFWLPRILVRPVQNVYFCLKSLFAGQMPRAFMRHQVIETSSKVLFFSMIFYFGGVTSVLYLCLSSLLYYGFLLHPGLTLWVTSHSANEMLDGQAYAPSGTFVFGPIMSLVSMNITYHCEHHDFPSIPWHRIKEVRKLAPEFYNEKAEPQTNSYLKLLATYFFDNTKTFQYALRAPAPEQSIKKAA